MTSERTIIQNASVVTLKLEEENQPPVNIVKKKQEDESKQ